MNTAEIAPRLTLPRFIRRAVGWRSPRSVPFDASVPVRIGERTFLLTHPDDIRHVLVSAGDRYAKTPRLTSAEGRSRAGAGVLTATGREHLLLRRTLAPLFRRAAVESLDRAIGARTARLLRSWDGATHVDLAVDAPRLAQEVILEAVFGGDLDDARCAALADAVAARRRHTELVHYGRLPFRTRVPTRIVRDYGRARSALDAAVEDAIARRRSSGAAADDLLGRLLAAKDERGIGLSDSQVRAEALTFTTTGFETIGDALAWALALVAQHDDVDVLVAAELESVLAGRPPSAFDLPQLVTVEAVLSETLRLFPPTWIYARIPQADDVLPSGRRVRAGSTLYVSPWVMHRDSRSFPDPERFDPGRWLSGARPPRYVYLPFGDGLHRCLGEHVARLEGVLVLAAVLQQFRLSRLAELPAPHAGVTLRPGGPLVVTVEPRAGRVRSTVVRPERVEA